MTAPVVRPFVAADAAALGGAPVLAGIGWGGLAALPAWTVCWDGAPAWAGGVVPTAPGTAEIWCLVAPALVAATPIRLAREIRQGLRTVARAEGLTTLTVHMPADMPPAHRRFAAWLGFVPEGACAFDQFVGTHTAWRVD